MRLTGGGRLSLALAMALAAASPAAAQAPGAPNRCTEEAAAIRRAEQQLPRLDVAPPDDQQIVCITLETNIVFARRLASHVAQCPRSPHARNADGWARANSQYTAQFGDRRCKPTIRGFRG